LETFLAVLLGRAVHLLNGLYDAKHDHMPVLALVGQVPTTLMNTDYFQELNENPIFTDVAVYNRTVMTAEQMPHVVDEAIRQAYKYSGVAVVTIPKDLGWQPIEDNYVSSANLYQAPILPEPDVKQVDEALEILSNAKHPVMYIGQGTRGAGSDIIALSEKLHIPIVTSALAKGIDIDLQKQYHKEHRQETELYREQCDDTTSDDQYDHAIDATTV